MKFLYFRLIDPSFHIYQQGYNTKKCADLQVGNLDFLKVYNFEVEFFFKINLMCFLALVYAVQIYDK